MMNFGICLTRIVCKERAGHDDQTINVSTTKAMWHWPACARPYDYFGDERYFYDFEILSLTRTSLCTRYASLESDLSI